MVYLLTHCSYLKDLGLQLQLRVRSFSLSFDGKEACSINRKTWLQFLHGDFTASIEWKGVRAAKKPLVASGKRESTVVRGRGGLRLTGLERLVRTRRKIILFPTTSFMSTKLSFIEVI